MLQTRQRLRGRLQHRAEPARGRQRHRPQNPRHPLSLAIRCSRCSPCESLRPLRKESPRPLYRWLSAGGVESQNSMIRKWTALLSVLSGLAAAGFGQEIPLCPGLTVVTAISQSNGDYESIKTVQSVDPQGVRIKYSTERPDADMFGTGELKNTIVYRTVLAKDLQSATRYQQTFLEKSDETVPETTAIGVSAAVLKALKTKGEAELILSNAYGVTELTANREKRPNYYDYMLGGQFKRVGSVRVPVLVNDKLVELPAIHAQGEIVGDKSEFFFLDDEKNPLTLKFRIGIGGLKPLGPEMVQVCETMKENNVPFTGVFASCNHPKGGDRDIL